MSNCVLAILVSFCELSCRDVCVCNYLLIYYIMLSFIFFRLEIWACCLCFSSSFMLHSAQSFLGNWVSAAFLDCTLCTLQASCPSISASAHHCPTFLFWGQRWLELTLRANVQSSSYITVARLGWGGVGLLGDLEEGVG